MSGGPRGPRTRPVPGRTRRPAVALLVAAGLVGAAPSPGDAQARPTLAPGDYLRWETPGDARLSPDGLWIAYPVSRVDGTGELRLHRADGTAERTFAQGTAPVFSPDGRHLAWSVEPSEDERERLEEEGEPVRRGAVVLELASGDTTAWEGVDETAFDATGRWLAVRLARPDGEGSTPRPPGADLLVRDLEAAATTTFGNVAASAWSEAGSLLALAVATAAGEGNGVQLWDAAAGSLRTLDASTSVYRGLAWREGAADLAVLRTIPAPVADGAGGAFADTAHAVLAWRGLDGAAPRLDVLDAGAAGLPDTLRVVEHRALAWADDGRRLALGLRPRVPSPGEETEHEEGGGDTAEPADVDIWHTRDVRIVPRQRAQERSDRTRSLLAVWHLEGSRVVRIGSDLAADAELLEGWRHGLERTAEPYGWGTMFGRPYRDVHLVDVATGERTRILERVRYVPGGSATGRYVLWYDGEDHWTYDVTTGRRANLTADLPATFADTAYDTPTDVLPPHGVGGWLDDDRAVLLHDAFDVWRVAADGSGGGRLTRGAEEEVVHRVLDLDRETPGLPARGPVHVSLFGEWTKRYGYGRLDPSRDGPGATERLVFENARLSGLRRADSAAVFAYTRARFDDPWDWFVGGPELAGARQVSALNPFHGEYAWGRGELVEYESRTGRRLQGALFYPAGWEAGRRYPMIVYQYEILSPTVHDFVVPSERRYYNPTVWTQQGYFVLMPDIVYRAREPGMSALDAVVPAVEAVVATGRVDPERVGLIGHSWGGYQATFLPTVTDVFAASVAGAPLTNFLSMSGAIHWTPGMPELEHWETGQARMEVPPWEDLEAHLRNSPAHHIANLEPPLLMMFGDEDGTVDWHQGIEFYNFARRAGKPMVMLVYEGEDHGLRQEKNQVDYHRRILEWFGHWLKGEPAPRWITDGVPLDALDEERERVARKGEKKPGG